VVTILDLTGAARLVQSRTYAPYEAFITAGLRRPHYLRPGIRVIDHFHRKG